MIYSLLADMVAFLHAILTAIIFFPLLCLIIGLQIPLWMIIFCLCGAIASLVSYMFSKDCFINPLERYFRRLASKNIYEGSFIAHYFHKLTGIKINRYVILYMILFCGIASGILIIIQVI